MTHETSTSGVTTDSQLGDPGSNPGQAPTPSSSMLMAQIAKVTTIVQFITDYDRHVNKGETVETLDKHRSDLERVPSVTVEDCKRVCAWTGIKWSREMECGKHSSPYRVDEPEDIVEWAERLVLTKFNKHEATEGRVKRKRADDEQCGRRYQRDRDKRRKFKGRSLSPGVDHQDSDFLTSSEAEDINSSDSQGEESDDGDDDYEGVARYDTDDLELYEDADPDDAATHGCSSRDASGRFTNLGLRRRDARHITLRASHAGDTRNRKIIEQLQEFDMQIELISTRLDDIVSTAADLTDHISGMQKYIRKLERHVIKATRPTERDTERDMPRQKLKARVLTPDELQQKMNRKRVTKCTLCKGIGHNSRTCKYRVSAKNDTDSD